MRSSYRCVFPLVVLLLIASFAGCSQEKPAVPDLEPVPDPEPTELSIGSMAPPLDIEHWVSLGGFEKVTQFEDGKVYVVEFWATWCGPCIASMPHISDLQEEYKDKGVQVISVSDQDLDTVNEFLEKEVEGDSQETYRELTSNYCLTTDPDRSVYEAYMEAASQNGIPTAFIVGKTGEIEWIGHPMQIDQPIAQVVSGQWDRDEYNRKMVAQQRDQRNMARIQKLVRDGEFEEAISALDTLVKNAQPDQEGGLLFFRYLIFQSSGRNDSHLAFQDLIDSVNDDAMSLNQAAWHTIELDNAGKAPSKELIDIARQAIDRAAELQPGEPSILDTQAHIALLQGHVDEAIEIQSMAIENASTSMASELGIFLDEIKSLKADSSKDDAPDSHPETDSDADDERLP